MHGRDTDGNVGCSTAEGLLARTGRIDSLDLGAPTLLAEFVGGRLVVIVEQERRKVAASQRIHVP